MRHFLFDDRVISLEEAGSFLESSLANFEKYGYGLWLIFTRASQCLVGFGGFLHVTEDAPHLIYGILPRYWGLGYATEAASALLRYAFESLSLAKVKADVDEPNVASVRVLEKLGMKRVHRAIVRGRPLVYYERCFGEGAG